VGKVGFAGDRASEYDEWFESGLGAWAFRQEWAVLEELLGQTGWRSLIDIGCGTGKFLEKFAQFLRKRCGEQAKLCGIDRERDMLEIAKRRLPDVELLEGDGVNIPFPDESFDGATMITVLEFAEKAEALLHEAKRVSRDGVIIGFLNGCSYMGVMRRIKRHFTDSVFKDAHFYTLGEMKRLLQGVGATKIKWRGALCLPWGWRKVLRGMDERFSRRCPCSSFIALYARW